MQPDISIRRDLFKIYIGIASLCLLMSALPTQGQQQQGQQQQSQKGQQTVPGNPSKLKNSFLKSQVVGVKEPDLPNFPHFTGKYLRFRGGLVSEGLTKGSCYALRYETAEKPEDVINWYDSALKGMGYSISEKKPIRLTATNPDQGIGVVLVVEKASQPGYSQRYRTHFTIRYIKQPTK